MPVNRANAYGVPDAPGIPSTLIPNNPVMIESTRPQPPKTAKLWVTRRLLSCIRGEKKQKTRDFSNQSRKK
jgi:hypothetical protein